LISTKSNFKNIFDKYLKHLDSIGFAESNVIIRIEFSKKDDDRSLAYYDPSAKKVLIGLNMSGDQVIPLREYTHHVLFSAQPSLGGAERLHLETSLADYFPCSFIDSPLIGAGLPSSKTSIPPYIFNLDNDMSFSDISNLDSDPMQNKYKIAEIWGALWWNLRKICNCSPPLTGVAN
jgi:hypothetical protein